MVSQPLNATSPARATDEPGYQVDDLIIDLGSQRVTRAGATIPLPALSFDLLAALARAAPNLVSFDQLSERVWPGLVATPETIIQRVKLVRNALGDDPQAPRYIEAVRGRGYRMVARVSLLTESRCASGSIRAGEDKKEAEIPSVHHPAVSFPSATPPPPGTAASAVGLRGWIGGALIVLALLAAGFWALGRFRAASKPAALRSALAPLSIHS